MRFTYIGTTVGHVDVTFTNVGQNVLSSYDITTSGTSTPSAPTNTSSSGGPAPAIQQFGKPATGTCDEAQPTGLDWAGVPSGGWTTGWGEWMNDGTGGWVCSRTLEYSSGQGKWVIA